MWKKICQLKKTCYARICSVQFGRSVMSDSLRPRWLQHTRHPCPSPTPRACSNSHPSSWWCHPTISSSVVPFSSCLQFFPASGSFPMSQFFASGGQNIGASTSASVLPMNIQDWYSLGLTGLISLQSKGLSTVLSNTTVQKHQFFSASIHQNHKFWRNNSRKNDETEPKQKHCPVVDLTGDGRKIWCCQEWYCIGTWNVRPWIKVNWKWSNRSWEGWKSTF